VKALRKLVFGHFDLCTGCRICELACSAAKFGAYAPRKAHITISIESEGLRAQPTVCIQCEKAPCIQACPIGAISRDEKLGAVIISKEQCTGCGTCVQACPIGAMYFDENARKATKCDLCDGDPVCVKYCPTKALTLIG
jgi:Fe-S-cluster-containing hydrogenase component 2